MTAEKNTATGSTMAMTPKIPMGSIIGRRPGLAGAWLSEPAPANDPTAPSAAPKASTSLDRELAEVKDRLLRTLADGPRRITELAELEGLAQPTITLLVKRLEERGLVRRERDPDDGRVVLVSLTAAGTAALEETRGAVKVALRRYVAGMSDEQLQALADSTETLGELIETIQHGVGR